MKRTLTALVLAGFAAVAWAQSAPSDTTDVAALAKQVNQLAANASKLKISGYALGAESFSPSDWLAKPYDFVDVLNKQQKNGTFARMILSYDSSIGGFNSRFEYDPNNTTIIALKYAEAYAKMFDTQLLIGAGLLRDTDFAYKSQVAGDFNTNLFTGVNNSGVFPNSPYNGEGYAFNGGKWAAAGGFFSGQAGVEALFKPSALKGLELGVVTNSQTATNTTSSIGNIRDGLSYLAGYTAAGLGDLKLGYTGASTSSNWSNFFVTADLAATSLPALKASISFEDLNVASDSIDGKSHSSANLFVTAGYDFRDLGAPNLWLGEDFGLFTSASTFGIVSEDKPGLSSSTRIQYTFKKVADSFDVIPMLSYRVFNYTGTASSAFITGSYQGIEPAIQVVAGSATFALGWGHYLGTTNGTTQPVSDVITLGTLFAY
jgi:hypothetical protein